ncbi:MAG: hypothetical protein DCC65_08840 [Planctomycetota bacterium]|nr:MAG: hypothetical protein DCC65_08840 [Planctomycetota bacterium]
MTMNRVSRLTTGFVIALGSMLAANVSEAKAHWGFGGYVGGGYYYSSYGWGVPCGPVFAPVAYCAPRPYWGYGYGYVRGGYWAPAPRYRYGFSFGYAGGGYRGGYYRGHGYYRGGGWGWRGHRW